MSFNKFPCFLLQLKGDLNYDLVLFDFAIISNMATDLLNLEQRKFLQGLLCPGYRLLDRILDSDTRDADYFNFFVGPAMSISHCLLPSRAVLKVSS